MRTLTTGARSQRGQVLVIFAIGLVAIVAMTGLVLDGGGTFVQRRDQQNVADAAALAAAYAFANENPTCQTVNTSTIEAAGRATAAANGYVHGSGGVVVTVTPVTYDKSKSAEITVLITKPHQNSFSGVVGMSSWNVTTTAKTQAGCPNEVLGAMPIIFNQDALSINGANSTNEHIYDEPAAGAEDVPLGTSIFNWTEYCDFCNADSSTVDTLINNQGYSETVTLDDTISPLNAGAHTTLFTDLSHWVGREFPVPLCDNSGKMVGWAMFHLTGSSGGSTKEIRGWFVSPINHESMSINTDVSAGTNVGDYSVQLID